MKKGQGQMVAFVLLVGFTVVIGIMVGSWAVKKARESGESIVERGELDAMCSDVAIAPVCGATFTIINKGLFKIKLKSQNQYVGGSEWIFPNEESSTISLSSKTVIPFIEIEGKEHGCSNRALTIDENTCI